MAEYIYVVSDEEARATVIGRAIHARFAAGKLPTCSLIGVQALAESRFTIEVEAIALVDQGKTQGNPPHEAVPSRAGGQGTPGR